MDNVRILIKNAVQRGQKTLSEYESKQVLASFNIPISKEYLTTTVEEAVQKAEEIGFPVVLKVCSHRIAHKTEGGLVEISLDSSSAVEKAFERLMGKISEPIDGILVQEMVEGKRELMLGMIRDPQFGPCVMVGFGGIMTEIINDTCFRTAPVNTIEAFDMLEEFASKKMLEHFRGQAPVDRDALCASICAVGAMGLEHDTISEIDINPLIIRSDGTFVAVDALVVLN